MIRQETARAAQALAEELATAGIALAIKPDSDLAALNIAGFAPIPGMEKDLTPEQITAQSSIPAVGFDASEHDLVLDQRVQALANVVRQHVSFAKNVARPAVQMLVERVQQAMSSAASSASFNPSVVVLDLPEPMRDGALISLYEGKGSDLGPRSTLKLGEFNEEFVLANLKTGSRIIDGSIGTWYARLGTDFFRHVWNTVFGNQTPTGQGSLESLTLDQRTGIDAQLAVFLLARNIGNATPPEGSEGTLAEIRHNCDDLTAYCAGLLNINTKRWSDVVAAKQLVAYVAHDKSAIYVNAPVYTAWADAGGSEAVLAANALQDRPLRYVDDINEKAEELLANWQSHNRILARAEAARAETRLGQALRTCGISVVQDMCVQLFEGAIEGEVVNLDSQSVLRAEEIIDTYVDEMLARGYLTEKTIWELCTDMIAKHVLADTGAHDILNGIDSIQAEYPELHINEVVTLVSIDYVTEFVAGQFYTTAA